MSTSIIKYKIPVAEPLINDEELKLVIECVKTGWISSKGEYISRFEEEFARYCGCKYGVAVHNGTEALHLALCALGIGHGDEVLVPDLTFAATVNAVIYTGAKPIYVDVHPTYWCIDPEKIEKKITKRTKAIIPVHLYGHPCDMDAIRDIAEDHGIYVIEDAAEAHGAEYKGRKVGSLSDVACFSFYGNKIITTGEGGMCLTNNEELAEKMRLLRNHGMDPDRRYWHITVGFNYRMTNIQAAIGLAQLKKIDKFIEIKRKNAKLYNSLLSDIEGIVPPPEEKWAKNVYWMYSVLVIEEEFGINRNQLIAYLEQKGIETRPFFYPLHEMPPYKSDGKYPISTYLSRRGVNLPSSVKLTPGQIAYIVDAIRNARKEKLKR